MINENAYTIIACNLGHVMDPASGDCRPCPVATYRTFATTTCTPCPEGLTTDNEGTTSISKCRMRMSSLFFLNYLNKKAFH